VESNVTWYTDTGLFSVYFACDKRQVERCLKLINKELRRIIEIPLSSGQLATAKRQYKGQLGIASENNESISLRMAKSYLHFNHYLPLEEVFSQIDAISAVQLQELAEKLFFPEQLYQLKYV
jgi:predicted Zn-dependent peptidase